MTIFLVQTIFEKCASFLSFVKNGRMLSESYKLSYNVCNNIGRLKNFK